MCRMILVREGLTLFSVCVNIEYCTSRALIKVIDLWLLSTDPLFIMNCILFKFPVFETCPKDSDFCLFVVGLNV